MSVFEMEKEFNEPIKHGQELIEKLKQEEESVKDADENDIGKLCKFWNDDPSDYVVGILYQVTEVDDGRYCADSSYGCWYQHCRRLTIAEVAEITGYKMEEEV